MTRLFMTLVHFDSVHKEYCLFILKNHYTFHKCERSLVITQKLNHFNSCFKEFECYSICA